MEACSDPGGGDHPCMCRCLPLQRQHSERLRGCCGSEQPCGIRTSHRLRVGELLAIARAQQVSSVEPLRDPSEASTAVQMSRDSHARMVWQHLLPHLALDNDWMERSRLAGGHIYVCDEHLRILRRPPLSLSSGAEDTQLRSSAGLQAGLLAPATVTAVGLREEMEGRARLVREKHAFPPAASWHRMPLQACPDSLSLGMWNAVGDLLAQKVDEHVPEDVLRLVNEDTALLRTLLRSLSPSNRGLQRRVIMRWLHRLSDRRAAAGR